MFYVTLKDGLAILASTERPEGSPASWESRNDWKSFERAEDVARELTTFDRSGRHFIATDAGNYTWPRYDVIVLPQIGDAVSKCFNGDSYPEGHITKISKSFRRIETSTGVVFWRHRLSGAWIANGTWGLTAGHHDYRNPSF